MSRAVDVSAPMSLWRRDLSAWGDSATRGQISEMICLPLVKYALPVFHLPRPASICLLNKCLTASPCLRRRTSVIGRLTQNQRPIPGWRHAHAVDVAVFIFVPCVAAVLGAESHSGPSLLALALARADVVVRERNSTRQPSIKPEKPIY